MKITEQKKNKFLVEKGEWQHRKKDKSSRRTQIRIHILQLLLSLRHRLMSEMGKNCRAKMEKMLEENAMKTT